MEKKQLQSSLFIPCFDIPEKKTKFLYSRKVDTSERVGLKFN